MTRAVGVAAGLVADRVFGEPPAVIHPVVGFGRVMRRVERGLYRDSRAAGVLHALVGAGLGVAAGGLVGSTAVATWVAVAGRALGRAATDVGAALEAGDLDRARELLPALVGRDPSSLDEKEIARAVVESVAENTVDAVVAPAFWAAVAGAPGALGYRAVNTLDAMVGHHSIRYEHYGWASARLDDVAGWVPARVTAALVAGVRPASAPAVWHAVRGQAPAHPSPNAGVAEAAFAAALGLRLGGENRYGDRVELRPPLGTGRPAEAGDIARAVALARDVSGALGVVISLVSARITTRERTEMIPAGAHGGDGARLAAALGVDPAAVLDLSASLNPLAPDAGEVVGKHLDALRRYPDPTAGTNALAARMGVDPDRLLLTNGGAEAIALVADELGGRVEEPDFSLYPRSGGPLWRSNPHNPTGRLATSDADIWDEAFYPLATGRWTSGEPLVVGSLTKLLACPGLRVGYVLGAPRLRQPAWSVNGLACAALPDLLEAVDLPAWAAGVAHLRNRLVGILHNAGLEPEPSDANFVLVRAPGLRDRLAPHGILVRDCASFGLPDHVRIAVPDDAGLDRLQEALCAGR